MTAKLKSPDLKPSACFVVGTMIALNVDTARNDGFMNGAGNTANGFVSLGQAMGLVGGIAHDYGSASNWADTAIEIGVGTPGFSVSPATFGRGIK